MTHKTQIYFALNDSELDITRIMTLSSSSVQAVVEAWRRNPLRTRDNALSVSREWYDVGMHWSLIGVPAACCVDPKSTATITVNDQD